MDATTGMSVAKANCATIVGLIKWTVLSTFCVLLIITSPLKDELMAFEARNNTIQVAFRGKLAVWFLAHSRGKERSCYYAMQKVFSLDA